MIDCLVGGWLGDWLTGASISYVVCWSVACSVVWGVKKKKNQVDWMFIDLPFPVCCLLYG